jgi:oxygen-independent coproporphyrinogen-3 oxidase
MCLFRLDLREIERKYGAAARRSLEPSPETFRELEQDGLVTFDGDVLRVTPLGQLLVRNVAMLFDAYLPRHARDKQPTFSRTV